MYENNTLKAESIKPKCLEFYYAQEHKKFDCTIKLHMGVAPGCVTEKLYLLAAMISNIEVHEVIGLFGGMTEAF